ncbi:unnamed protein product, partial [Mesorhabditis belari]|uniref:histone acetyltransferase n=1 Tax=Mesorhabditis belari TaxID=2138241 RepID=A0AAF3EY70_9BILA
MISRRNRVLFNKVTREYQDTVEKAEQSFVKKWREKDDPRPYPKKIRICNFEIYTWYTSLYPLECAAATTLRICDFCLRYFVEESLYQAHVSTCQLRHPPGDEIYRKDGISVYEVDGYHEKDYCRRACLLGKCFIDCKSSVNGGPLFLFYVLTRNDEYGQHFVGYFSKSKEFHGNALSCIAILPCFQGCRYGHFLIELSYCLMQRQGLNGTPERPLTESGRITYGLYWRSKILEWFGQREGQLPKEMNLYSIANDTGITVEDLANTMDLMDWFGSSKDNPEEVGSIDVKWAEVKHYMKNKQPGITFDKDSFKWTPGVYDAKTGKRERTGKMADDETGKCERVDRKAKQSIVQTPAQEIRRDQGPYGVTTSDEAGFAVVHDNAKGLVLLEESNVHYDRPSTSHACFNRPTFNSARQGPLIRSFKRQFTDVVKWMHATEGKQEASLKPRMSSIGTQTDLMASDDNGDDVLRRASGRRQLDMSFTEDDVQDKNTNEIKQEAISSSF